MPVELRKRLRQGAAVVEVDVDGVEVVVVLAGTAVISNRASATTTLSVFAGSSSHVCRTNRVPSWRGSAGAEGALIVSVYERIAPAGHRSMGGSASAAIALAQ